MMTAPPSAERDAILEEVAQLVEAGDLLDVVGCMARRKRAREDAALRTKARTELKAEMARLIRAFKGRADLDPVNVLARIVENGERTDDVVYLRDAWPLAWKGWLNIYACTCCNSNSVPPAIFYKIELTERGRGVLEARPERSQAANAP